MMVNCSRPRAGFPFWAGRPMDWPDSDCRSAVALDETLHSETRRSGADHRHLFRRRKARAFARVLEPAGLGGLASDRAGAGGAFVAGQLGLAVDPARRLPRQLG